MKEFNAELYRRSILDLREAESRNTVINRNLIYQCDGREASLGVVIGRDGKEYQVSNTWLKEKTH